jgi:hypothetical protein
MKSSLGRSRAGSFLLRMRGSEPSTEQHQQPKARHTEVEAPSRRQMQRYLDELNRQEKTDRKRRAFGTWRLLLGLRLGSDDKDKVSEARDRNRELYESDDDESYAEDDNRDSGRVGSRRKRRKAKKEAVYDSGSENRSSQLSESEEEASTSDSDDPTEECVAVNSSSEDSDDEESYSSSSSSSSDDESDDDTSDSEADSEDESERRRRKMKSDEVRKERKRISSEAREEASRKRKEEEKREREREKMKVEEEKQRQKVEKRKLRKVEKEKQREERQEIQRQLLKLREEKERRRKEEKDLKELERIEKAMAKSRERDERKARKQQKQEDLQREKMTKQKQMRELILARLGRSPVINADVNAGLPPNLEEGPPPVPKAMEERGDAAFDSVATGGVDEREETSESAVAPDENESMAVDEATVEQEEEVGRRVDESDEEDEVRGDANDEQPEVHVDEEFSRPSISGLPSTDGGPAKEVVIAVSENPTALGAGQSRIEPQALSRRSELDEEVAEAEDEAESEVSGGRRVVNSAGRVTEIPALRLSTAGKPSAAKRSPSAKVQASPSELIRGLIGFDELEDALFELTRQVEELRSLAQH